MTGQLLDDEAEDLRQVLRRFICDNTTEADSTDATDERLWRRASQEVGLTGVGVPQEYGGSDLGLTGLGLVFEEFGRRVSRIPLLSTLGLAAPLLARGAHAAVRKRYLPQFVDGTLTAAVVPLAAALGAAVGANRVSGCWELTGAHPHVIEPVGAGLFVVAAPTPSGVSLFAVHAAAPGLTVTAGPGIDPTRLVGRVQFDGTRAELIGEEGSAADALSDVRDEAAILLAAESIGGAATLVDMAVAYATTRVQFAEPIGQFQAVQHRCSDMHVDLELARSGVLEALRRDAAALPLPILSSLAKVSATDCYARVAAQTLQVHGGIGFTWDHPVHWHLKRAKANQAILGTQSWHQRRISDFIGLSTD